MHLVLSPPPPGGPAAVALAAALPTAGTVVAVAVGLLFVWVIWLGHRASAAPPGGPGGEPDAGTSGDAPASQRGKGRR
jgi:hypothetical protein